MTKHVLIVTTVSSTVRGFLIPHIDYFLEEGYTVTVASNFEKANEGFYEVLCSRNVNIESINFSRNPFKIGNILKSGSELKELRQKYNFSHLYTHTPIASFLSRYIFRNDDVKKIYFAHGLHFYKGAPIKNWLLFYPIEKIAAKWTDAIITINNEDYVRMKKMSKGVRVVKFPGVGLNPNFVDSIDNLSNIGRETLIDLTKTHNFISNEDFIIISVGELNDNKNQMVIIKSVEALIMNNENINLKYFIVGDGENKGKIKKYITDNHLSDNIFLMGFRTDVAELLLLSDLLVSMSFREGLPINVLESMYASKPVILSDIRGHSDLINNEKFLIANVSDHHKLSVLLSELMLNGALREVEGKKNYNKSIEFLLPNVLEEVDNLFETL